MLKLDTERIPPKKYHQVFVKRKLGVQSGGEFAAGADKLKRKLSILESKGIRYPLSRV